MAKKVLLFLSFTLVVATCFAQKKQEKLIRESFEKYKSAILNDRGEEAAKYVDSRTMKYYSDIAEMVQSADSLSVRKLNIMDKLMVFTIRHNATKEEILNFDGEGLLIYAIEAGMVGKSSVAGNTIGTIVIEDSFAKGQLVANEQPTDIDFHFYNEDQMWKIDLTSIFPVALISFKQMQEDSGQNEVDFLFKILEMVSGNKPDHTVWREVAR